MRIGLTLLVALMATAFSFAAWAEPDTAVVETVDAADAMQSSSPDLSGLDDEADAEAIPAEGSDAEAEAASETEDAWEETEDAWEEDEGDAAPAADDASEAAAWDDLEDGDLAMDDEANTADGAETDGIEPMEMEQDAGTQQAAAADTDEDGWAQDQAPIDDAPQIEQGTSLVVNGVELGPVGIDGEGRVGRVHTVKPGDTLWDVSHAYLGTAWVWPSVWNDNDAIQNPHLIEPGDRLWISSTEIRAISQEEAEEYLAEAESAVEGEPEVETVAAEIDEDFSDFEQIVEEDDEFLDMAAMDEFAGAEMDQLPVGMPDEGEQGNETGRTVRVSMRENMSFVSDTQLQASTSILGSPSDRRYLAMLDTIYFGLGEGEVEVGDEFTFFRNITDVRSPSTRELLGYHVDVLGWAEVVEVTGDTCVAVIRVSIDGAVKGDRVMPRYQTPSDITVKYPEEDIEGEIAFLPASRTLMGTTDYVFVDVGAVHGVEIGTDLEVYDGGSLEYDGARDADLQTPDRVVADLVVVTVQEESAVAFVAHTRRGLAVGDSIRGATREYPSAF
ncbi:MAG: LysM peptidoglycan-binding domain-containing protein [bacterium]|nr:LysM peptidoglycan-binding domain-containing protein [bacterium]